MAYIDEIAAISQHALSSKNTESIAHLSCLFHSRFGGFGDGGHAPLPDICESMSLRDDGFTISFADNKHLHYARCGRSWRWLVSDSAETRPNPFDSHEDAISMFQVPFAFLEGIQYCMDCYQSVVQKHNDIFIDQKEREIQELVDKCCDLQEKLARRNVRHGPDLQKRIASPRMFASCKQKAVVASTSPDDPPPPPSTTVNRTAARASFVGISGVYFLWAKDIIDYVGRSNCIGTRLSLSHHKMRPEHQVSVVEMTASESWVAEAYYIWRYRPRLNSEVIKSHAARDITKSFV